MEIPYNAWTSREVERNRGIFGSVVQHLRNDNPQDNENSAEIMRRGGYRDEHFRWSRLTSAITTGVTGLSYRIGAIPWDHLLSARKNYRDPLDRITPSPRSLSPPVWPFVPNQIPRLPISRNFDIPPVLKHATQDKSRAVNDETRVCLVVEERRQGVFPRQTR